MVKYGADPQRAKTGAGNTCDPIGGLDAVLSHVDPAIFLFKDLHDHLDIRVCPGNLRNIRRLRDVAHALRDTYKTVVLVSPVMKIPVELSKDVAVVEFGTPSVDDFNGLLDRIIEDVKDKPRITINLDAEGRERLVHAARGLTLKEAENVFAKTLVLDGKLDADDISVVFSEKQQIIRKSGTLEYYESQEQFAHVAGLENLKDWLSKRSAAFSERAAQFGLPAPKGVLLLGVQGCGKSLCAKAASSLWKLPLLRFDIGRVFGSLVGSSEESMRRAIQTAESVAPAILWIDEIDKAFAGTQGSAGSDGGTASRVFGTFLTWLSEKTAPVFVIATANDISHLPPELLRKGRVDEIFFVDLPTEARAPRDLPHPPGEAAARPGAVRPRPARPPERRLQRRRDRGGDHLRPVRRLQPGDRPRHRDPPRGPGRDGAAVPDDERGAEPPAELGAGPCPPVLGPLVRPRPRARPRRVESWRF